MQWFFSPITLALLRPFMSKEGAEAFKSFIVPLFTGLLEEREKGNNLLLYDAPLAMYFYSSPYCELTDAVIAATYATLAAESLGLGSCMIGSVSPMLKKGAARIKKKYGIPATARDGIMVTFGYPKFHYRKAIKRTFAQVTKPTA